MSSLASYRIHPPKTLVEKTRRRFVAMLIILAMTLTWGVAIVVADKFTGATFTVFFACAVAAIIAQLLYARGHNRIRQAMANFGKEEVEKWTNGARVWRAFGEFRSGVWLVHLVHNQTHVLATIEPERIIHVTDEGRFHTAEFTDVYHVASTDGGSDEIAFNGGFRISGSDGMRGLRPWSETEWAPSRATVNGALATT